MRNPLLIFPDRTIDEGTLHLRRIRSLEAHVADIRQTQTAIQNTLLEIATHLRGGAPLHSRSPSSYPPFPHHSPSAHSLGSPGVSTPSTGPMTQQHIIDTPQSSSHQGTSINGSIPSPHTGILNPSLHRQHRDSISGMCYFQEWKFRFLIRQSLLPSNFALT